MSEGSPLENETELLAWAVLHVANRTQARGTTIRLVVPRAPEVADDLDIKGVTEERIVEVEEWLVERGYLAPADVVLTRGTYTITPAGLDWLREGKPEPRGVPQEATDEASSSLEQPAAGETGAAADPERAPWWRKMFGR